MPGTTRRTLLASGILAVTAGAAGGCYAMVQARVLPGREFLAQRLGRCGTLPPTPDVEPGRVEVASYGGKRVVLGFPPSVPPSASNGLPVVLMLHGASGNARTPFEYYGLQYYWPAGARLVVAGMDDWDPYAGLTDDLLPFLGEQGFDTSKIGLLGWSMGGHGALEYAGVLGRRRVAAVATASAAIDGSAVPDLVAGSRGIPVDVTCGRDDSFAEANMAFLAALGERGTGGLSAGCHDTAFRRRMLPRQLRFFTDHLGQARS